jgi:hypothetical protein
MTAICNTYRDQFTVSTVDALNLYQITAVTFDGDYITMHIEAASAEDAAELAGCENPEIDYILF